MPRDKRQEAMDEAARVLRDAGCIVVSILASWADGDSRTSITAPKIDKKRLGRGLKEIDTGDQRKKVLG